MVKIFLMMSLLLSSLLAYQKGDVIEPATVQKMGLTEDKLYIVDFFASWCGSCKKELPLICKVQKEVDKTKVEIIGVDIDTDVEKAKEFQRELQKEHELAFRVINDPEKVIVKEFQPLGVPALYYIRGGKVIDVIFGAVDDIDKKILGDIKKL